MESEWAGALRVPYVGFLWWKFRSSKDISPKSELCNSSPEAALGLPLVRDTAMASVFTHLWLLLTIAHSPESLKEGVCGPPQKRLQVSVL